MYALPSLSEIIFVIIFILLSTGNGKNLLADGDTGYHIRTGDYIRHTQSIPDTDIYIFHNKELPYTGHQWLSETIMSWLHEASGLTGIVIYFSFLIALLCFVLIKSIEKECQNNILVVIISLYIGGVDLILSRLVGLLI